MILMNLKFDVEMNFGWTDRDLEIWNCEIVHGTNSEWFQNHIRHFYWSAHVWLRRQNVLPRTRMRNSTSENQIERL